MTPIYVPDSSEEPTAGTFASLIYDVHRETRNHSYFCREEITADGDNTTYRLRHQNIVDASQTITVGGSSFTESTDDSPTATEYIISNNTGEITLGTTPASGTEIVAEYTYRRFSEDQVKRAINVAIESAYPEFYVLGYYRRLTSDGDSQDYILPSSVEAVTRVEILSYGQWGINRDWALMSRPVYSVTAHTSDYLATTVATTLVLASGHGVSVGAGDVLKDSLGSELVYVSAVTDDTLTVTRGYAETTAATHSSGATWSLWSNKYLHFSRIPISGSMRVHYVTRPSLLSGTSDTLESTSGIPTRARGYIVSRAVWELLKSAEAQRVFDDRSHNTQGTGQVRSYELTNVAASWQSKWQFEKQTNRMKPWSRS